MLALRTSLLTGLLVLAPIATALANKTRTIEVESHPIDPLSSSLDRIASSAPAPVLSPVATQLIAERDAGGQVRISCHGASTRDFRDILSARLSPRGDQEVVR